MSDIPTDSQVFLDTNVLLYAITEHPRFGLWCDALLDRIQRGEVVGYISVLVLNELIHKLIIGEVAQKVGLKPAYHHLYEAQSACQLPDHRTEVQADSALPRLPGAVRTGVQEWVREATRISP
jgi:predicted nucleic acid-binding protein